MVVTQLNSLCCKSNSILQDLQFLQFLHPQRMQKMLLHWKLVLLFFKDIKPIPQQTTLPIPLWISELKFLLKRGNFKLRLGASKVAQYVGLCASLSSKRSFPTKFPKKKFANEISKQNFQTYFVFYFWSEVSVWTFFLVYFISFPLYIAF